MAWAIASTRTPRAWLSNAMTSGKRRRVARRTGGTAACEPGHFGNESATSPMRSRVVATWAMNSSPKPTRRWSYQSAALRSSARASGCSSTRTPLLEFLQDGSPDIFPSHSLDTTLCNFLRTPFQLRPPGSGDFIVRFFQAEKQFLCNLRAFRTRKTKCFGEQLVSRHEVSLTLLL